MESTFMPYMIAFMWMSGLLLLSVWLRTKIKLLQYFLVPSSITAGILGCICVNMGLIGYPTQEGWVAISAGSFGLISFHLFSFGFGVVGLSCLNKSSQGRSVKTLIWGALWFDLLFWIFYALQATIGFSVFEVYNSITGSTLNSAVGFLAGLGFTFGPGQTLTVGMAWENSYGMTDAISIGLAFAAAGFLVANLIGVPLASWGLRKGYATYSQKELTDDFLLGLREESKQEVGSVQTTHSGNLDTITLHFAIAALVYGIAYVICYILKNFVLPAEYETASFGFIFMYALVAGVLVRFFVNKTSMTKYYDDGSQNRVMGVTVDFLILSSLMAVNAVTVFNYFIPFLITVVLCTIVTLLLVLWFGRRVGSFGLERLLALFGLVTGTAASGLSLLRIVDGEFKSPAAAEMGLNNIYSLIPLFPFLLVSVTMPAGFGISGMLILNFAFIIIPSLMLFVGHKAKIWGPRQF